MGSSYDAYEQWKRRMIGERMNSFKDYADFLQHCVVIMGSIHGSREDYQLKSRVAGVLADLIARNPDLAVRVLQYYLQQGDPLDIRHYFPYDSFVKTYGPREALAILNIGDYPHKEAWLLGVYTAIPEDQITYNDLDRVYALHETANSDDIPRRMDYLLKYQYLDTRAIPHVVGIIVRKAESDDSWGNVLWSMFHMGSVIGQQANEIFCDQMDLLKKAYLIGLGTDAGFDYGGEVLNSILDDDPRFICEVLDCLEKNYEFGKQRLDPYDFSFLWLRDDFEIVVGDALNHFWGRSQSVKYWGMEPGDLFWNRSGGTMPATIVSRQDQFLEKLIQRRHDEDELMQFVFEIVADLSDDRKCHLLSWFAQHDHSLDRFKQLPLRPSCMTWWGSMVPVLQNEIDFLTKLKNSLTSVALLQHRAYINDRTKALREEMEREKKRDFMDG